MLFENNILNKYKSKFSCILSTIWSMCILPFINDSYSYSYEAEIGIIYISNETYTIIS